VSLLVPWLVFPIVCGLLWLGCGSLVARLAGLRAGLDLVLPLGYAVVVVVASLAVWVPRGAPLTVALVVGTASVGLATLVRRERPSIRREGVCAFAAAFLVLLAYGAPILLSGQPTFAGYISLDDSATWFALTDRALEHGRDTDGLAPSSYEATLDSYLSSGYPLGAFLPLGIGAALTGQDVAWVFQPFIASLAALLALVLFALARSVVLQPWARAVLAVVAAQPALLYAYAHWTGVKELSAALLIPLCCALAAAVRRRDLAGDLAPAAAAAALLAVLSPGGAVWLGGAVVVGVLVVGLRAASAHARRLVPLTLLLTLPALAIAWKFARSGGDVLTSGEELGNLVTPLDPLQIVGVWPSSDFRLEPADGGPAFVLVGLVALLAFVGVVFAAGRRAWAAVGYPVTAITGAVLIAAAGSPWVDGKALATASPAVLFASLLGCSCLLGSGRRVEAAVAAAAIAGGVLWSNALAFSGASLAPHDQLVELEEIGERFAGQGPALMTEYQPYGVRHFLRRLDPEGVSELRRRRIPRLDGTLVEKGQAADLDELALGDVLVYRTIVLRRSPATSRPASPYVLRWQGVWYEVWQRTDPVTFPVGHLALGAGVHPAAVPRCSAVRSLASSGRTLAVVERADPLSVLALPPPGQVGRFDVPRRGSYSIWLGGSTRVHAEALVDGRRTGGLRQHLNTAGQYSLLGTVALAAGRHELQVRFARDVLRPGSGGQPAAAGPVVIAPTEQSRSVSTLPAERADGVCDRVLDWVEALP
jgi:hypothetical protein